MDDNKIAFKVYGKYALFTDPVTKIGGEKCTYPIPTYEALRGIARSIYWKPTFLWKIDKVRIVKSIRTASKGIKPMKYHERGNELAFYSYLTDVEYHVLAHYEWNFNFKEFERDRDYNKHSEMLRRYLERGGTRDIFLGTRECQGYVESIEWSDEPEGKYKDRDEISFGLMFHSFLYPEESGKDELICRLYYPTMRRGEIDFSEYKDKLIPRFIRKMQGVKFVNKTDREVEIAETDSMEARL